MSARTLDRVTLFGIGAGIALMFQPLWQGGFRVGFFATIVFTLGQIAAAHLPRGPREPGGDAP